MRHLWEDRPDEEAAAQLQVTRRGLVLFALMSVIWGIPYLLIRIAVGEMSPEVLVLARTSIGVAVLLPIALAAG